MQQEYYQIFENGFPLHGMMFQDRRTAMKALKEVRGKVEHSGRELGWYKVEQRLPYLPVRLTIGFRKIYADGSSSDITYMVRRVVLKPVYERH